jgi:fermentation-respiration switch protein FrsA (DUF1100 family)
MGTAGHEGITGITFDSDGHCLVGVAYLAHGDRPRPTALLLHGCPGLEKNLDLAVVLRDRTELSASDLDREFIRFLATTPAEFLSQRDETGTRPGPLDVVASISPRPLLVIHGSDDEWVGADQGRLLYERAGEPRRYVEIKGANHAFAWHRDVLCEEISRWLMSEEGA